MPDVSINIIFHYIEFPALFEVHQRHVGGQKSTQEEKGVNREKRIQDRRGKKLLSILKLKSICLVAKKLAIEAPERLFNKGWVTCILYVCPSITHRMEPTRIPCTHANCPGAEDWGIFIKSPIVFFRENAFT
jgi:hypothetical protein